jgi:6-phosphofructokinase 1
VVSEGLKDKDGKFLSDQGVKDAFGHAQLGGVAPAIAALVKRELNLKYHWAVLDYLQRSARHLASAVDLEQAVALGEAAVKLALEGQNAVTPIIVRTSNDPYTWEIGQAQLADVANVEKKMPLSFITPDGFGITSECRDYLLPLIQGEAYPPLRNGLPDYVRLKNERVAKKTG